MDAVLRIMMDAGKIKIQLVMPFYVKEMHGKTRPRNVKDAVRFTTDPSSVR